MQLGAGDRVTGGDASPAASYGSIDHDQWSAVADPDTVQAPSAARLRA
jgi:hypothetical protein